MHEVFVILPKSDPDCRGTWDQTLARWVSDVICQHCQFSQEELARWRSTIAVTFTAIRLVPLSIAESHELGTSHLRTSPTTY